MKLVILNSKSRYRPEDQKALEQAGAVFYQSHSTKLTDTLVQKRNAPLW